MALRFEPDSLSARHNAHDLSQLPYLCPYCAGLLAYGAMLPTISGDWYSPLAHQFPLSLVLELEGPYLNSCWQWLAISLTSIKSLNAVSLNFLSCEMRLTIPLVHRIGIGLILKSIIHLFHKHLLRIYLLGRQRTRLNKTGHLPWRSSLWGVEWLKEYNTHIENTTSLHIH